MQDYRKTVHKINSIRWITVLMAMIVFMAVSVVTVNAATLKVNNATGRVNSEDGVNLRKTASSKDSSNIITGLPDNTKLTIKSVKFTSKTKTSAKYKWYKVSADGNTGYVRSDYVDNLKYTTVSAKTTTGVNYRVGAGTEMTRKGTLKKGTIVTVYLKATPVSSTAGETTTWYMVKVGSKKYYASSKYFKAVEAADDPKQEETKTEEDKKAEEKAKESKALELTLADVVYPKSEMIEGCPYSIEGKIKCNKKITKVDIGITDSDGEWLIKITRKPDAKTFDISEVDSSIKFGILAPGTYRYKVVVTAGDETKTAFKHKFTIKSEGKKDLTDEIVTERINELLDTLCDKYFTSDKKACNSAVGDTCNVDNVLAKNSTVRNLLAEKKGGKDLDPAYLPIHYSPGGGTMTRGWSCCGFANFAGWYIAADTVEDDISYRAIAIDCNYDHATISKYGRVGDILRSTSHSYMIISVESDGCVVIDSNWNHDCKVTRHLIEWSKYTTVTISRASNRD